jgi:predicted MFS family arabinose efflux permease
MLRGDAVLPWPAHVVALRATATLAATYLLAALCALPVRGGAARQPRALRQPDLLRGFARSVRLLWRDRAARIALSVTCVFWAAAAVLQFVVLRWAVERLGLTLSGAGLLQAAVACGMIVGAAAAGRWVREEQALALLPASGALGAALVLLSLLHGVAATATLLFAAGVLSGLVVVPMNTVLQRRGLVLMQPGAAIAAQNCSENLASLAGLAVYGATLLLQARLQPTVMAMGIVVCLAMAGAVAHGRPPAQAASLPEDQRGRV